MSGRGGLVTDPSSIKKEGGEGSGGSWGGRMYSLEEEQRIAAALAQEVEPGIVRERPGKGRGGTLHYLEHQQVVGIANRIFGPTGWKSDVKNLQVLVRICDKGKWTVGVSATVNVELPNGGGHSDVGWGDAKNFPSESDAVQNAIKSAISDARKRALRNFGSALGMCLYDKEYLDSLPEHENKRRKMETTSGTTSAPSNVSAASNFNYLNASFQVANGSNNINISNSSSSSTNIHNSGDNLSRNGNEFRNGLHSIQNKRRQQKGHGPENGAKSGHMNSSGQLNQNKFNQKNQPRNLVQSAANQQGYNVKGNQNYAHAQATGNHFQQAVHAQQKFMAPSISKNPKVQPADANPNNFTPAASMARQAIRETPNSQSSSELKSNGGIIPSTFNEEDALSAVVDAAEMDHRKKQQQILRHQQQQFVQHQK